MHSQPTGKGGFLVYLGKADFLGIRLTPEQVNVVWVRKGIFKWPIRSLFPLRNFRSKTYLPQDACALAADTFGLHPNVYTKFNVQLAGIYRGVSLTNRTVTVTIQSLGAIATINRVIDASGY
jgi:hypothetical protein